MNKRRQFYARWHRRLGIISACFVLLLSGTGLVLNHSDQWQLPQRWVNSPLILAFYGQKPESVIAFKIQTDDEASWVLGQGRSVFWGERPLLVCNRHLVGALRFGEYRVIACDDRIAVLDERGGLLDILDASYGLPEPIQRLGICGTNICLRSDSVNYRVDIEQLEFDVSADDLDAVVQGEAPESLLQKLEGQNNVSGIHWERVVLDLHAGRFLGAAGIWIMDFMAISFFLLAISGIYLWLQQRRKKNRSRHNKLRRALRSKSTP